MPKQLGKAARGVGRADIVARLTRDYRLWATLPSDVEAIAALATSWRSSADAVAVGAMLAIVPRPRFPAGVCRTCGCTDDDPCLTSRGPCAWIDDRRTQCTNCDARAALRAITRGLAATLEPKHRRIAKRGRPPARGDRR